MIPVFVLVLVRRHRTKTIIMTTQTTSRVVSEIVSAVESNRLNTDDPGAPAMVSASIIVTQNS